MGDLRRFRLCGEVDGRWTSFPLAEGDNHVGSLPTNDIVLTASGVSRHHAVLAVQGTSIALRDLASKNGTQVRGRPVACTRLAEGDEVTFGRCRLRLETLAADEAELAIRFRPPRAVDTASPDAGETTFVGSSSGSAAALPIATARSLIEGLCQGDGPDLGGALDIVRTRVDATACWLLERGDEATVVLATAGAASAPRWTRVARHFEAVVGGRRTAAPAPSLSGCVLTAGEATLGLWVDTARQPQGIDDLLRLVLVLVARLRRPDSHRSPPPSPPSAVRDLVLPDGHVAGISPAMRGLYDQLRSIAQGDLPTLILGETGVGKEHLAHALHASSTRADEPFEAVNCAAVPHDLLEAELFGVEAGAATGVAARDGTFRRAHRGTLFLDEIGDMTPALQAKMLRALQEHEVQPVGGRTVRVDVRVVAATNVGLASRIEAGRFRADLYYRLAGVTLEVPPLRDRPEDIPSLVEHFVRRASQEIGKPIRGVTVRALRRLMAHPWPGNVRELENEIRRLVYRCRANQVIDGEAIRLAPQTRARPRSAAPTPDAAVSDTTATPTPSAAVVPDDPGPFDLETLERQAIERALAATGGIVVRAAQLLGISRDALRRRMKRLGL